MPVAHISQVTHLLIRPHQDVTTPIASSIVGVYLKTATTVI